MLLLNKILHILSLWMKKISDDELLIEVKICNTPIINLIEKKSIFDQKNLKNTKSYQIK